MRSVIFLLVIIAVWGMFLLYFALDYYPVFRRVNQQVQNYNIFCRTRILVFEN